MCQAIVKPSGVLIEQDTLRLAWQQNSDGAGFAVRLPDNSVVIHKGFFKFKRFWKHYQHFEHLDCLIHFRFATHGTHDEGNCHPFPVGDNAALIHNGILSRFLPHPQDPRSDTRLLVEDFLIPSLRAAGVSAGEFFASPSTKALLTSLVGGSKLAMLTAAGFVLVNEGLGEWHQGAWYSAGKPTKYEYHWQRYFQTTKTGGYAYLDSRDPDLDYSDDQYWEQDWQRWSDEKTDPDLPAETPPVESCTLCEKKPSKLFQVGIDYLCRECWDDYTTPARRPLC